MPNLSSFKSKEEYTAWYRKYRINNKEKLREYNKKYNKLWRNKNGTKKDCARSAVYRAIKKSIIQRGCCEICGINGAEGHHLDYSKPLNLIWLCPLHHKDMHRKSKNLSTIKGIALNL